MNFVKGERQCSMDYGFDQAVRNTHTHLAPRVAFCYDVNCIYSVNLPKRITKGQYLNFRPGLNFIHSIGMFHVHGHRDVCYARYAPRFIPGMGTPDGETLERLFSVLNRISTIARTMTLAHRSETLDSHMGDNNFKKMINMVPSLCKKWKDICSSAADARADFDMLNESAKSEQINEWARIVQKAEVGRANGKVDAMDVYNIKFQKGASPEVVCLIPS